jgi:hypothetical protein
LNPLLITSPLTIRPPVIMHMSCSTIYVQGVTEKSAFILTGNT